jgi:ElaB/YqjD/DUF883 family membrane-anchored ribosome-binding protein
MESEMNRPNGPGTMSAQDILNHGSRVFDETKRAATRAYDRSAKKIGETYDHALAYGRHHPGKTAIIAFGIGVGVGVFLLGANRRSRVSRYGEPLVNALSDLAIEFIRGL